MNRIFGSNIRYMVPSHLVTLSVILWFLSACSSQSKQHHEKPDGSDDIDPTKITVNRAAVKHGDIKLPKCYQFGVEEKTLLMTCDDTYLNSMVWTPGQALDPKNEASLGEWDGVAADPIFSSAEASAPCFVEPRVACSFSGGAATRRQWRWIQYFLIRQKTMYNSNFGLGDHLKNENTPTRRNRKNR